METVVALFDSFPEFPFAGVGVDAAQAAFDLRKKIEAARPEVADILLADVLRFVSDSIETMERLGEKPGPVDEDRDFL
jgi:hypothetical protein